MLAEGSHTQPSRSAIPTPQLGINIDTLDAVPFLTGATVVRRADDVVLTWRVQGDLEKASSPWLLCTDLIGGEHGPIHQFGFRYDGHIRKRYRFDLVTPMNLYMPTVQPERHGNVWTAVFPASDEVALSGRWEAHLRFDEPEDDESSISGTFG